MSTDNLAIDVTTVGVVLNNDAQAAQNTTILKKLFLSSGTPIFMPEGTIAFNDTLVMGIGVKVFATPRTTLKLLSNVNGIVANDKTLIEDLTLRLPTGYSQTGILIDGTKHISTCTGRNIRVEGTSGYTGVAIRVAAINTNDYVSFVDYDNVYIKNVDTGIIIEDMQDKVGTPGWANGNRFNNVTITANNGISLKGRPTGNEINFQFQTVSSTVNAIYCEGSENYITGFVWDIDQYGSTGKIATFTQKSKENVVALPPADINKKYIQDDGINNFFPYDNQPGAALKPLNSRANYTVFPNEFRKNDPNFFGVQDNCLAFIDKRAKVTVTGSIMFNPGVSTLFTSRFNGSELWFNDPSATPVVIEIDTSPSYIDLLYMIGMSFINGVAPADYKIDLVTSSGGPYSNIVNVTGNRTSAVIHELDPYGIRVYKIKITITKAIYNPTLNPTNQIRLSAIYGANNGTFFNSPFLFKDGGTISGDIDMNKNKLTSKVWESGATASRPSSPAQYQEFFDTTLGKPIWRVGNVWKDATGATV